MSNCLTDCRAGLLRLVKVDGQSMSMISLMSLLALSALVFVVSEVGRIQRE